MKQTETFKFLRGRKEKLYVLFLLEINLNPRNSRIEYTFAYILITFC